MTLMPVLGLVAGNGDLPLLVARGAKALGHRVVTAALMGETGAELKAASDVHEEVALGDLGGIHSVFKRGGATQVVMVGGFSKQRLFSRVRPDLDALMLVARLGR